MNNTRELKKEKTKNKLWGINIFFLSFPIWSFKIRLIYFLKKINKHIFSLSIWNQEGIINNDKVLFHDLPK